MQDIEGKLQKAALLFPLDQRYYLIKRIRTRLNDPLFSDLLECLSSEPAKLAKAFRIGLDRNSCGNEDDDISSYFFLLSELDGIPSEAREFALDVSVQFEEGGLFSNLKAEEMFKKKIEPLLLNRGS